MPLLGVAPVKAPSRGCANHQFTGGYDFAEYQKNLKKAKKSVDKWVMIWYDSKAVCERQRRTLKIKQCKDKRINYPLIYTDSVRIRSIERLTKDAKRRESLRAI